MERGEGRLREVTSKETPKFLSYSDSFDKEEQAGKMHLVSRKVKN